MFFLYTGLLLLNSSQVVIITRVIGPEAVAVWDVATKSLILVQMFVTRIWESSMSAIAEMIVRGERDRMWARFQDILVLTGSVGVWAAAAAAVCNGPFLAVWTHGRIAWPGYNDALMAVLVVLNSITRLHISLAGQTKEMRGLKFIYFLEGASFVLLAIWAGGRFGLTGILGSAILMNLLWSGLHGIRRTAAEMGERPWVALWRHQIVPLRSAAAMALLAGATAWLARDLTPIPQLAVTISVMFFGGLAIFWRLGLTAYLRREPFAFLARLRKH